MAFWTSSLLLFIAFGDTDSVFGMIHFIKISHCFRKFIDNQPHPTVLQTEKSALLQHILVSGLSSIKWIIICVGLGRR